MPDTLCKLWIYTSQQYNAKVQRTQLPWLAAQSDFNPGVLSLFETDPGEYLSSLPACNHLVMVVCAASNIPDPPTDATYSLCKFSLATPYFHLTLVISRSYAAVPPSPQPVPCQKFALGISA
jgi:hypothetical protein